MIICGTKSRAPVYVPRSNIKLSKLIMSSDGESALCIRKDALHGRYAFWSLCFVSRIAWQHKYKGLFCLFALPFDSPVFFADAQKAVRRGSIYFFVVHVDANRPLCSRGVEQCTGMR